MAKYAVLKSFYASEEWQRFRLVIINERGLWCQHCGQLVTKTSELTLHHIIELTPENVCDATISLNPDNILLVCHDCHNKLHARFGHTPNKEICVVYGPPLSGKSTFVRQHIQRGDMVVDMDSLYAAVSMLPNYDKPDNLLTNVRGIYTLLIDNIKTRYGKWNNAWIIGGFADRYRRERLAEDLGAELVFCNVSKEECLRRLDVDEERRFRKDEWRGYIVKWFEKYME